MSQIELAPKTRDILELTIPKWTKKLASVNFDGRKLGAFQHDSMDNMCECYIGELHNGDSDYDECLMCEYLSQLSPHVFKTDCHESNYETTIKVGTKYEGMDFGDIENPNVTVDKFLKYVANHIQNKHRDIMKKCEVSK